MRTSNQMRWDSLDDERNLRRDLQVQQFVETAVYLEEERGLLPRQHLLDLRDVLLPRLRHLDLNVAPTLNHAQGLSVRQRLLIRRVVLDDGVELVVVLRHGGGVLVVDGPEL